MAIRSRGGPRVLLMALTWAILIVLLIKYPPRMILGQGARSWSLERQEHLTFWVNHNGLEQLEVEGQVGFGDMARILLRRRSNVPAIRRLRDRFTFKVQDLLTLETPDLFRVEISDGGLIWRNRPSRFVVAAGRTFNLPLIVDNRREGDVQVEARLTGESMESTVSPSRVASRRSAGYFLRLVETRSGPTRAHLVFRAGNEEIRAEIHFEVRALATLRGRILDEGGRPAAARVYLTASDGLAYAPSGSISRMTAMGAEFYFHAEGAFELELPSGATVIEATRGPEYQMTRLEFSLEAGQQKDVEIPLKRWENMARRGWYSGDAHIHANYTAPHHQVVLPADVRLMTLAEDLNNANMMVANSGGAFIHDQQYFEGRSHRLSTPRYVIYWNEEMRNRGMYGHMSFFNLTSLVHPLYTGFENTPHWEHYPPNHTQARAARRQGGVVTYVHPAYAASFEGASAKELPVDAALGEVDAVDVLSNANDMASMELWYRLLNCGFRVAISAGTDSFTNVSNHYIPGGSRVYVQVGNRMDYGQWVQNYRRGRSFASNGPVIFLTVEGQGPGAEIRLSENARRSIKVKATVRTQVPLDRLEIVANGRVIAGRSVAGQQESTLETEVTLGSSSWVAARALGPWHRLLVNDQQAFAHTSPVYVYFGDRKIVVADDVSFYRRWIEQLMLRVDQRGRFATESRKQEVLDLFEQALDVYRSLGG